MISTQLVKISRTTKSKLPQVDFNNIPFGKVFSDHMVEMNYADGKWQEAEIKPYGPIPLAPATSSLHYGQAIFEGMKANKDIHSNDLLMFRPQENAKRFNRSAVRMGMPELPVDHFMELLVELIKIDRNWCPEVPNSALYLRPFMIGADDFIGVRAASNYKFITFTCPVGPYYAGEVHVQIEDKYSRAFPGGTGDAKAAGNYAATLYPAQLAKEKGFNQILWTDGIHHKYVEEIGTMNVFFQIDGEIHTPELTGTILPGVTRESVIQLFRDAGVTVHERKIDIQEIFDAHDAGKLEDVFGSGTAATITHISSFGYKEKRYTLKPISERKLSNQIKDELVGIKTGLIEDRYNWLVRA